MSFCIPPRRSLGHWREGMRVQRLRVWVRICGATTLSVVAIASAPADADSRAPEPVADPVHPAREVEVIQIVGSPNVPDESAPVRRENAEGIAQAAPVVLSHALGEDQGVHVQSTTAGQGSPYVRGLTGSAVLTIVDGMRLNHAIYRSSPNPYLDLIDPGMVETLDVVRGPSSVLYGSDAMGGVILVASRPPDFDTTKWSSRGRLSARFGSSDLSRRFRADVEAGHRRLGLALGLVYSETEHLRSGGGRQRPTDYESLGGDARLVFRPNEDHLTRVDVQFLRQPSSPRYDQLTAGFDQTEPSSDEWSYEPLERLFAHASHTISKPLWGVADRLRFDVAFQRIRDDRRTRDRGSSTRVFEENESALLGFAAAFESRPTEWIDVSWGGDAYLDDISSGRKQLDLITRERSNVASRFPDGSRMNSFGAYVRTELRLSDTWTLAAGARFSHFDTRVASTPATPSYSLHQNDVTGGLGLSWSPVEWARLSSNLRRGFRAPNIFDLGTLGERPGNRFNIPSSNLDPEELYSVDLGVALRSAWGAFEIFGFGTFYRDKIVSTLTGATTPDGRDIVQSRNADRVTLAGVEASAELDIREDLFLHISATWTWGEEETSGGDDQPADRIPPLEGRAALRWEPTDSLWAEVYTRFAARQDRLSDRDRQDSRIDPKGSAAWVTGNFRVGWRLDKHWSATLEVHNLSDTAYRIHGSGLRAPGVGAIVQVEARY